MHDAWQMLKRIRGMPWLLIAAFIGILLLLIPTGDHAGDQALTYSQLLEHRIAQMTDTIPGVENVSVLVTLERDNGRTYSVYGGDAEEDQRICGIAVTCIGGGDAHIRLEILQMLCAAFDLTADRVWIGGKDAPYVP